MTTPKGVGSAEKPYVAAVVAEGKFVFVSGQTPTRNGALITTSVGQQTDLVLENIADILASSGSSLEDVVRCGVFLADLDDLPEFNAAYVRAFGGRVPARTAVGVKLPGYSVEIDCIAKAH